MRKIISVIGILLCLVPMIGFGLCGVFGVTSSFGGIASGAFLSSAMLFGCGALGLAISIGLGFAIRGLSKNFGSDSPGQPPAGE